ncbi:hypothetical protein Tco_0566049 [Tanacetum coccineum]
MIRGTRINPLETDINKKDKNEAKQTKPSTERKESEKVNKVKVNKTPLFDLNELEERSNICTRYGDTWTWVASGPERQQAVAVGAHEGDEGGSAVEELYTKQTRVSTWMFSCMTTSEWTAVAVLIKGIQQAPCRELWMPYQTAIVRPRTGDASTSAAPHVDDQPDP